MTTPLSATQDRVLREIWCSVLGLAEAHDGDHFFAVGGDSLAATGIVMRIRRRLGVTIAIQDVFNSPTFAELSAHIGGASQPMAPTEEIRRVTRRDEPVPASLGQEQFFLLSQHPRHSGLMSGFFMEVSCRVKGALDPARLHDALSMVVDRHEPLRTVFQRDGQHVYQRVDPRMKPSFEFVEIGPDAGDPQARVRDLIHAVVRRPFDRTGGSPISLHIYAITPTDHVVLLIIDHLVADGLSLGFLMDDLYQAYAGLADNPRLQLPAPSWQFLDWVDWQRRTIAGKDREALLRYWRKRLGPSPDVVGLPLPGYTGHVSTQEEESFTVIDEVMTTMLRAGARARNVTLFAYVLGGVQAVIARETGRDSFCVKTSIVNRVSVEDAGIFGPLAHDIFLRTTMPAQHTVDNAVREVQRSLADASLYGAMPDLALWTSIWPGEYEYLRNPNVLYFSLNRVWTGGMLRLPGMDVTLFKTLRGPAAPGVEFAVHDDGRRLYFSIGYTAGSYRPEDLRHIVDATVELLTAEPAYA